MSVMSTSRKFLTAPVFVLILATAAVAQGTGRWMSGAVMPSERTEVAVAEVREKIYVVLSENSIRMDWHHKAESLHR